MALQLLGSWGHKKYQKLFSGKNKKNINVPFAEYAMGLVKVKLTCAAILHSTTLVLKSEEAALFFSTQQLETTNVTPSGSVTSCSLSGLKSIFLACKSFVYEIDYT